MTIFLYSLAVIGMILIPVGLAIALRRKYVVAWFLFCVGMVTFVGSQTYHIPLNNWLTDIGVIGPIATDDPNFIRTAVILGFSAAICETLARVVGYAVLFRYKAAENHADGIMVGLGHGGIEAMLFGAVLTAASLTSLLALQGTDLTTLDLTAEQLSVVSKQLATFDTNPLLPFVSLFERLIAMTLHVTISVMVWRAFKYRQWFYIVVGILYHALFDFTAVYVPQQTENIYLIEALLFVMMLPGAIWLWRTWPKTEVPMRYLNSVGTDLRLFGTALSKELREQWHSKRILVVCAVFVLFGLTSPLLAKYTPELLTSIEGAEQLAELIPEPTAADAMVQYIKNITQFGFILVILLGMGAVAGEKDKGTAAMILSKPLTRWSFVLSKFTAQALVYLLAIGLAAIGAFYYTLVLFEPLAVGPFFFGTLLLWLWLLIYAAVTLLGSTWAKSVAAGAGIALGGSIVLLAAGSFPQIGALMPSSLVAWASQLGLDVEIPANWGAVAFGIVLILVFLVTAVAVIEQQEIE